MLEPFFLSSLYIYLIVLYINTALGLPSGGETVLPPPKNTASVISANAQNQHLFTGKYQSPVTVRVMIMVDQEQKWRSGGVTIEP